MSTVMQKLFIDWIVFDLHSTETGDWVSSVASNHYRVLGPSKALFRAGHKVRLIDARVWHLGKETALPDMVVVGKLPLGDDEEGFAQLMQSTIGLVHKTQSRGIPVVAEFSDDHFDSAVQGRWLHELARSVDGCVTATETLAVRVRSLTNKPVAVVGTPILFAGTEPRVFRPAGAAARFASFFSKKGRQPLELIWYDCAQTAHSIKDWLELIAPLRAQQRFRVTLVSTGTPEVRLAADDFNRRFSPRAVVRVIELDESTRWEAMAQADIVLVPPPVNPGVDLAELDDLVANALHAGRYVIADTAIGESSFAPYVELTSDPLVALVEYLSSPDAALSRLSQGQSQVLHACAPQQVALEWIRVYRSLQEKRYSSPVRILFFASELNNLTFELRYALPLREQLQRGEIAWTVLTELGFRNSQKKTWELPEGRVHVEQAFASFKPTIVVFCRYAGPYAPLAFELARQAGIPTLMHLDDDLFDVPREFGPAKFQFHNDPRRLETLGLLVSQADLVVTANTQLINRLVSYGFDREYAALPIAAGGPILRLPSLRPTVTIGYMGGADHVTDLPLVIPALIEVLREFPHVHFELIGEFQKPDGLDQFGERVKILPPLSGCEAFMRFLARRDWDIGLCVLAKLPFNLMKTNLKWIDYARIGAVAIASRGTVFDDCCADGGGLLVDGDEEWLQAMRTLILQPEKRLGIALRNQAHLRDHYGMPVLTDATLATFARAAELHSKKKP